MELHRTIYLPWELGKDTLLHDPIGPCVNGSILLNNTPRAVAYEHRDWMTPVYGEPFIDLMLREFHRRLFGLGGTLSDFIGDSPTGLMADMNSLINNPHDRALFAQWYLSGIPDPTDAHIERMADRRMYFEVIMLEPEQQIPAVREPVEAKVTVGDLVVA